MDNKIEEVDLSFIQKAEKYCAQSEQCMSSVRAKLLIWGASRPQAERVIKHLCQEGFIDEHRYSTAYCDSKIRNQHWGRIKISYQLRSKQIKQHLIDDVLAGIDPEVYRQSLVELTHERWKTYKDGDIEKNKKKLMSFLATKGFEMEIIKEVVDAEIQ